MTRILLEKVGKRFSKGKSPRNALFGRFRISSDHFWALDGVDLSLEDPGASLGIVGTNGSGKTTLLRIIAGVTGPTHGRVTVCGRVVPLLEAAGGMQPDLTGRENIFLNGIILGMRRREIQRKLDSIVDFAGVQEFLDLPLKHYSWGMITRLGFSVASHVDSDILLVDEAWSITDVSFQQKSFDRLAQLRKRGVLFILVSHDHRLMRTLTNRVLWLHNGRPVQMGPAEEVLDNYLKNTRNASEH